MTIQSIPPIAYQVAFNAAPNQTAIPPWWTDLSSRVQFPWTSDRGRQYELDQNETGEWRASLANPDGALDPSNTASPFAPNLVPYRQMRIKAIPGPNLLTADQATAGEGTGYGAGPVPGQMGVTNDFGYTVTIASSLTAYQGAHVFQTVVPSGATASATVLLINNVPVVPATTYSFSVEARITSGTSTPTGVALLWYSAAGVYLGSVSGTAVALTSGSSSWTMLSVSGQPPTGATNVGLKVQLGGTTSAQTTWQVDGLQWEANGFATQFQVPFTVPVNLLPQAIANGSGSSNASAWFYASAGSLVQGTFLTAAPTGQTSAVGWQSPIGTTSGPNFWFGNTVTVTGSALAQPDCCQVTAAQQYTGSWYAMRLASADATLQITPAIFWFTVGNVFISQSNGTAVTVPAGSWARVTASGTAPAGAAWGRLTYWISSPNPTTAQNTIYTAGAQFEQAASASTWVDPGPVYQIINGFIERWPQTWTELDGSYGTSDVVGPDQLTALAQYTLTDPFVAEVLAMNPNFFYQLNDPAGSTSCADTAARRVAAPVETSPYGAGSVTFGSSVTSVNPPLAFVGTPGPVATFANNLSGPGTQTAETYIALHKTTVVPGPPPSSPWTRMVAFRCAAAPGTGKEGNIWTAYPASWNSGNLSSFWFQLNQTGQLSMNVANAVNAGLGYTSTISYADGNWHLAMISGTPGSAVSMWVDGANVAGAGFGTGPSGIVTDAIGCSITSGTNSYSQGFVGDVAFVAEFPIGITAAQVTNLYNSFRTASSGESSGARINRILKWIGWSGPTSIATGSTASMGPATDLSGDAGLDAINAVVLTENGNFFASNQGVLTFQARNARYNQSVPAYLFGENAAGGEYPFEVLYYEDDPSHIANNVQITQYGGSVYTAIDAASTSNNFPRVYQRTVNTTSVQECQDAASYLLSQYKNAAKRVEQLRLHPSAVPGLFNVCLAMEIGTLIQINRRPTGAPLTSFIGFVEKVSWNWDPENSEVFVDLQCSPINRTQYWVLAALHTTLNAQATSGTNTAVINALPDSAVNPLAASLPQNYALTFEPGTIRQETLTIQPPLPSTVIGYSTATLTFTSNFAFTHPANSIVCEQLPAGLTNPAAYDALSVIGANSAAFALAATSGTNTITVGPLPDAKVNAVASDWNIGDLLQLSPGTPRFEGYNILTPNQATAGEGVLPLAAGTSGTAVGITGGLGTPTVTASGSAFQGANVWQVAVGANAATPTGLLYLLKAPASPLTAFTGSAYVRSATTGANPQAYLYVNYYDINGNFLSSQASGTSTLTGSPTAAWTRLVASGSSPAAAVWAQIGIVLTGTSPTSAWTFQADGLQFEANASASAYQTCPQVLSVATTYPGYASCVITLANNLASNHSVGDIVCDPLPPGDTSPSQIAATAIPAY